MKKLSEIKFGRKGVEFGIPMVIFTVLSLALVVIFAYLFYFQFFNIKTTVNEADVQRHAYTLANVVLSSNKIVYDNEGKIYRGIFDKTKLDSLNSNAGPLFSNLGYPASSTQITVEDLDSDTKWSFGGDGPQSSVPIQAQQKTYQVVFPITIRISVTEIHAGKMTLQLTEKSLA